MSAPLLLAVLLAAKANGPVEYFWERDLFGAVRALADGHHTPADHAPLVTDLIRLAQCEPLPAVAADDPDRAARLLVRLEAARGARLGAAAKTSPTVWRDLLDPNFFSRKPNEPSGALYWPVEEERWPDEALSFRLNPGCSAAPTSSGAELALLPEAIERALAVDALASGTANAVYQRMVLLVRAGRTAEAQEAGKLLVPSTLQPREQAYARLMRLELALDPPSGFPALVDVQELAPVRLHLVARAAAYLNSQGRFAEAAALTTPLVAQAADPVKEPRRAIANDLLCRHASALVGARKLEAAAAALPLALKAGGTAAEPAVECLRDLAMELASLRPRDAITEQLIAQTGTADKDGDRWVEVAARALTRRELEIAYGLASRAATFPPGKARLGGDMLLAEIAWARADAKDFGERLKALFARTDREGARARSEREKAALVAGQALVNRMAEPSLSPALHTQLLEALRAFRREALRKNVDAAEALLAVAEKRAKTMSKSGLVVPVVAVGDIAVSFAPPSVPPAPSSIDYPEPYSLLAVPAPGGSFVPWFVTTAPAVEVTDAT